MDIIFRSADCNKVGNFNLESEGSRSASYPYYLRISPEKDSPAFPRPIDFGSSSKAELLSNGSPWAVEVQERYSVPMDDPCTELLLNVCISRCEFSLPPLRRGDFLLENF